MIIIIIIKTILIMIITSIIVSNWIENVKYQKRNKGFFYKSFNIKSFSETRIALAINFVTGQMPSTRYYWEHCVRKLLHQSLIAHSLSQVRRSVISFVIFGHVLLLVTVQRNCVIKMISVALFLYLVLELAHYLNLQTNSTIFSLHHFSFFTMFNDATELSLLY